MKVLLSVSITFALASASLDFAGEPRRLPPQALARAEAFVRKDARPLDQRRLEYFLRKTDQGDVIAELGKFQNSDGGFGRNLDPDVRCPESSTVATLKALGILREVDADADHPMVQAAVRYLVSHFDDKSRRWPAVPPQVNDSPHPSWWHVDAKTGMAPAESPLVPSAEVLSALYRYEDLVPAGLLEKALQPVLRYVDAIPDRLQPGEAIACVRLAQQLSSPLRETMLRKVRPSIIRTVARDRSEWSHYCLRPLMVADAPASPLHHELRAEVEANLDYLIATQDEDGGWLPYWSWEGSDAAAWKQAAREWRGVMVIENLRWFRVYGRL